MKKEDVVKLVYECIDELNYINGSSIIHDEDTVLFGVSSELDSLDFVSLIVSLEQKVSQYYGINISITAEKAMSKSHSPFRTVKALSEYVLELMQ